MEEVTSKIALRGYLLLILKLFVMEKLNVYQLWSRFDYPGGIFEGESFGYFTTREKAQKAKSFVIDAIKASTLHEFKCMRKELIDSFFIVEIPLDNSLENFEFFK